jgi:hypothetical protein
MQGSCDLHLSDLCATKLHVWARDEEQVDAAVHGRATGGNPYDRA